MYCVLHYVLHALFVVYWQLYTLMKCFPIADQVFNGVTGILIETRCMVHSCFQGNEVDLAIVFTSSFHQVPKAIAGRQWGSHFFALVFANGFKKGTCPGSYGAHSTHSVSVLCSKYKLGVWISEFILLN